MDPSSSSPLVRSFDASRTEFLGRTCDPDNRRTFPVVTSWLDGAHVVFGKPPFFPRPPGFDHIAHHFVLFIGCVGEVVEGMEVVRAVEAKGTASGTPKCPVKIANSGTL